MPDSTPADLLKMILANLNSPQALDAHPWAVLAQIDGTRLVEITVAAFRKMTPPSPPREGKRMDTRWGVFGILAAQYFLPLAKNAPPPSSLRDAWDSIDKSILFFALGEKTDEPTEEEQKRYLFAGKEPQAAPNSTLSDWHRRGIERLAEQVQAECAALRPARAKNAQTVKRAAVALAALSLVLVLFFGWKGWRLFRQAQEIERKAQNLQALLQEGARLEQAPKIAAQARLLRNDLDEFYEEAAPYLWASKYAGWAPKYGGALRQAEDLLIFSQNLAVAADDSLSALAPAIQTALDNRQPVEILDVALQMKDASPKLLSAQLALARAQEARRRIDVNALPPRLRDMITLQIDPLLSSISGNFPMQDALDIISAAPDLLGAGKAGPQSYLILMQNEDELRPTGGFLTAAGLAVIKDGKLISINIESSDSKNIDDFSKPYPVPPWQFREFMNIRMFLLRDSNWFTDFPTTVSWTEYFYSYARGASADGVITLDMQVIVELLKTLGPARVPSTPTLVTYENAREYLRSAEKAPPKGADPQTWDRKKFIAELAKPILEKVLAARGKTWSELAPVLLKLLDEKHILLQFDDEKMADLLLRRNWDGAVRIPDNSDFWLVAEANMGYNKSNAAMETALEYEANLSNLKQPTAILRVTQTNLSTARIPCEPYATYRFNIQETKPGEIPDPVYNIDECHWGYWRAYLPQGTRLIFSNPQEIPDTATWLGKTIPPRTDDLGDEGIPNAQVFGMMTLIPTNASHVSTFEYVLPERIVSYEEDSGTYVYRLKIQKQPGTLGHATRFRLIPPEGMKIESASLPLEENAGVWQAKFNLTRDVWIEIKFKR